MVIGIDASRANIPEKTGTEWYAWEIIRALAPRLSAHQIRLYTREPLAPGLQQLGAHVEARVLTWPVGILWSHLRLAWEIFWHQPDILFVPADTIPLIHPPRTYTTIHDIAFERWPELYSRKSVQRKIGWIRPLINLAVRLFTAGRYSASERDYHRWSVRHALRVSRKIITVSEFTKQELVTLLQARPDQIEVTYQGVAQPEEFNYYDQSIITRVRQQLALPARYFLYIGRLEAKKNIGQLIYGYQLYRQLVHQPTALVLIGRPGFGWSDVAKQLSTPTTTTGIYRLTWQPPEVLQPVLKGARAFIFLSNYEGFGRPPLEACSAGVPVIAARATCLPEIIGPAALFVDHGQPAEIAQAMLKIDNDQALRQELISRGYQRVRQFQWSTVADQTARILLDQTLDRK